MRREGVVQGVNGEQEGKDCRGRKKRRKEREKRKDTFVP